MKIKCSIWKKRRRKRTKIFISHAKKDIEMVRNLVELLYSMGLKKEDIFCSSIPELGIPIKKNIHEYLRKMIKNEDIYTFFILSENYYESVICLIEMGAVWVKSREYITFLVPGFDYSEIKGIVDKRDISICMDEDTIQLKKELNSLKLDLEKKFRLHIDMNRWEFCRNRFIEGVQGKSTSYD